MKLDRLYHGKKTLRTTIIALLIVGAFLLPAVAEINKVGTYFWIDPERNIYGDPGGAFSIAIKIANAPSTYAWELKLSYNTTVLNVTGASEGDWLSGAGSTSFFSTPPATANAQGYIAIADTLVGPSAGASGNGWLCNVTFQILAVGRSDLSLDDTFLLDLNLVKTDYPNNDGYFCANDAFSCLHDVYVVSVEVDNDTVQQGTIVLITVTIHNEGNHTQDVNVTITATTAIYPDIPIWQSPQPYELVPCVPEVIGPIPWDTTTVPGEKWILRTEAIKVDAVDDDPHDNVYIGPEVLVRSVHDIKVTDVTILTPKVHKGDIAKVNVTVHNEGKVPETVNVTLFAEHPEMLLNFTWLVQYGPSLEPCYYYQILPPFGPPPLPCTWWHIIEAPMAPWLIGKEFHVDEYVDDTFHIDFVWPDHPEPIEGWVLAEQEIVINQTEIVGLEPCVPTTITLEWNTTGFDPIEYVVGAIVRPPPLEEMKNWLDNKIKDPENVIEVIYSDIAVASIQMLDATTCYSGGFNPIAIPELTLANLGLTPMKVVVYFIADPDPVGTAPDGDEIYFGLGIFGPLASGTVQTFRGCSPYGGWDRRFPTIIPPYANYGVPGTNYTIIANAVPVYALGYSDDNPANDANVQVNWTLPVVSNDVAISSMSLANSVVYKGNNAEIEVTVVEQANTSETFDVTLNNGTTLIGSSLGQPIGALATNTVTINLATDTLKACEWYILFLNGTVTISADDDPCDNVQTAYAVFYLRLTGDVSGDGLTTGLDVLIVTAIANFGKTVSEAADPLADVTGDGLITGLDVLVITSIANFGKACPP